MPRGNAAGDVTGAVRGGVIVGAASNSYRARYDDWAFSSDSTTSSYSVWRDWNNSYVDTSTGGVGMIAGWREGSAAILNLTAGWMEGSAAVLAASASRRELQEQSRSRGEARFQEIETAKSRAEGLLREHLTDRQKSDLESHLYFDVVNFRSKRYYRIKRGRAGNVFLLDGPHGRAVKKFCCHPNENVPDADTMLAQKLLIEFNEELFLKTANITDLSTGEVQVGQGLQARG